jgi:hypothetical protein
LCGQTCLHKLVDDFMARALTARVPQAADDGDAEARAMATDTSLTSSAAHLEVESSARLLTPPVPINPQRPPFRAPAELVAKPVPPIDEPPRYASRNWRAEAWNRERERELRTVERRSNIVGLRRSGS